MSRVPLNKREEVVELWKKAYSQRNIAALTGCRLNTVNRIVQAYRDEGRIKDAPHERRPRATSADQDLQIVAAVNEKPFLNAKEVRSTLALEHVSDSTVRRRLREAASVVVSLLRSPSHSCQQDCSPKVRCRSPQLEGRGLEICHLL